MIKTTLPLTISMLLAPLASAAIISISDHSISPDGSNTRFQQGTNINVLNGNTNVLRNDATPEVAYMISHFTFGVGSDAHLAANFDVNNGHLADRIGVRIQDNGFVDAIGTGGANRSTFDFAQDMAGQRVVVLAKFQYDQNNNVNYTGIVPGATGANDDTLMNVWLNPTSLNLPEDDGLITAGDMYALWNSSNFAGFDQSVYNQGTPGTAGASSVTQTIILTGSDATFANALAIAVPEPSSAVLGALGMMSLLLRRRR